MFSITVAVCDLSCLYYVYLQYICICIKFISNYSNYNVHLGVWKGYIVHLYITHTHLGFSNFSFFCYVSTWALCGMSYWSWFYRRG